MRHLPLAFVATLLAGMAVAASSPTGLDALSGYAGTWQTEIEHLNTPYSAAGKEIAVVRNVCWRSADFYACHQYVNGKSAALLVFSYDARRKRYRSCAIPAGSGQGGPCGEVMIRGNVWMFPWQVTANGKTTYFRVINVWTSPDSIDYRQEFSVDRIHWTLMAKGREQRTSGRKHL